MDAQVQVEDATGCIDADLLFLEAARRLAPSVTLVAIARGDGEQRQVELVARAPGVSWSGSLDLVASDCGGAEEALVAKVVAGLSPLCTCCVVGDCDRPSLEWTLPAAIAFGIDAPGDVHAGLGLRARAGRGDGGLVAELGTELGLPRPGGGTAAVEHIDGRLRLGWQVETAGAVTLAAGLAGGGGLSWSSETPRGYFAPSPAAEAWVAAGLAEAAHPRVGMRLRLNLVRSQHWTLYGGVAESWVLTEVWVAPVLSRGDL